MGVAIAAVDTLEYYASQRVLRALSDLRGAADKELRAKAAESFHVVRSLFEVTATEGDPEEVRLLREWMEPVRDLVAWPDEVGQPERGGEPPTRQPRVAMGENGLRELLDDLDGEWAAKKTALRNVAWAGYTASERGRLAGLLRAHPDPVVREIAMAALVAWSRSADLLTLTSDASGGVRKAAMYHLSLVPRDPSLAEPAWIYMMGENGTTAYEALQTYAVHAEPDEAKGRLVDLARRDTREAVVTRALSLLVEMRAGPEIVTLLPLLDAPPGVTWAVHIELLDAVRKLGLPPPPLDDLAAVDNLYLVRKVIAARAA